MFVATRESDPREQGDPLVGEGDTLVRFLRGCRPTLELKCEGLDTITKAGQADAGLISAVRADPIRPPHLH
jgi:hypothetical protein